jgi:DNA-3-methyladenine glycosylase II
MHTATGALTPRPPFDFNTSLDFLGEFSPTTGEQSVAERRLTKALQIGGRAIVFQATWNGAIETPRLDYTLFAEQPIDAATQRAAADRIRFFLSLDDDLQPFYAIGRADPAFAPVIELLYGYHQVKFPTPFESACWAILSQRNAMPAARTLKQALVEHFGVGLELDGVRYEAFPEPARLAAADLHDLIRDGRRAEYVGAAARAFVSADEAWLRTAPYDEALAWLRGITGIGPWSASFVLLRGLGRMEHMPAGEQRHAAATARRYNAGQELSDAAIRRIAERYGIWQGYWAHYLRVAS